MLTHTQCHHCEGPLEFDTTDWQPGTTINCPHCGKETALDPNINDVASTAPKRPGFSPLPAAKLPPPARDGERRSPMTACLDCAERVSKSAIFCPNCGSMRQSIYSLAFKITIVVVLCLTLMTIILWAFLTLAGIAGGNVGATR